MTRLAPAIPGTFTPPAPFSPGNIRTSSSGSSAAARDFRGKRILFFFLSGGVVKGDRLIFQVLKFPCDVDGDEKRRFAKYAN